MKVTRWQQLFKRYLDQPFWTTTLPRFFCFEALGTTYRTEILAGITTFMTTAPFLVVNAHLLSNAIFLERPGDLFEQILVTIAVASALASSAIGVFANYPFALGPGTGLVALFAFSVVLGMNMDWRLALAAVLVQGLIFTALTVGNFHRQITNAIPASIKQALVVGLGLLIAYVGLSGNPVPPTFGAGIIVASPATKTALGSLQQPATLIAIFGILLAAMLMVRRVKGALLFSILAAALIGWGLGIAPLPQDVFSIPRLPTDLMGQAIAGFRYLTWNQWGNFFTAVFILLFVAVSDTIGSLTVLGQQVGRAKPDGELPKSRPALLANAAGTAVAALIGTIPVIPYLESASGIFEGGRSGFVAIVTAILFLCSIGLTPLFAAIPAFATAPVLVMVSVLMMGCVRFIDWSDLTEAIPAFLIILLMPLTFSVADGLAAGLIAYPLVKAAQEKANRVKGVELFLAAISIAYFALLTLQR